MKLLSYTCRFWKLTTAVLATVLCSLFAMLAIAPGSSAASSAFTWQGDSIVMSGLSPQYYKVSSVTLTRNGSEYKGSTQFYYAGTGQPNMFGWMDFTITLTSGNTGSLSYVLRDIPGQQPASTTMPNITINGTPPPSAPQGPAPTAGSISGSVTLIDESRDEIPDRLLSDYFYPSGITIQMSGDTYDEETTTNSSGNFTFLQVPPGTYTVTTNGNYTDPVTGRKYGYGFTQENVVVNANETTTITFSKTVIDDASLGQTQCSIGLRTFSWLFCPMFEMFKSAAVWADAKIIEFLMIKTDPIFNTSRPSGQAFYTAWQAFRTLAYALLVILGLIMVISQIAGFDIFDAYTIRKMLPKLVIAAIFIPLLWPILRTLTEMANSSGIALMELIRAPFEYLSGAQYINGDPYTKILTVVIGGFVLYGAGGIAGGGVLLALAGSIALALLQAFFVLVGRDLVFSMLVIASPVAVVLGIFEPSNKVFALWRRILSSVLLSIPGVAGILAISKVGASVAYAAHDIMGTLLAAVIIVIGYMLFWGTLKSTDKIAGQIDGALGRVTGGAQKALSKFSGDSVKQHLGEAVEGRRVLNWVGNRVAGIMRRGRLSGQVGAGAWGIGRAGRAQYREAVRTMQAGVAAKMMEQDKDRAGGDDDAMRLLGRRGMNRGRFIREYADIQQRANPNMNRAEAEERARRALGLSETSLGASAGTDAMRIAAQRSLLKSNTSYRRQWVQDPTTGQWQNQEMDFAQMSRTMYGDVAELVQDGLITVADGASMIKSNTARMDRAGVGFGTTMAQLEVAAGNAAGVGGVRGVGGMNIEGMLDDVMSGTGSGQMLGQRHETVRMLAPEMLRRAQAAAARDYTPDDGFGPQRQLGREFIEQVAMAAGRIDLAGQLPELNAALNANSYIGAQIEPNGPTVGQWVEFFRTGQQSAGGQQIYQNLVDGHAVRIAAQNGLPQNHPTVQARARQETDQQIADAQRVFQEYRREYGAAWQGQPQGQNVP